MSRIPNSSTNAKLITPCQVRLRPSRTLGTGSRAAAAAAVTVTTPASVLRIPPPKFDQDQDQEHDPDVADHSVDGDVNTGNQSTIEELRRRIAFSTAKGRAPPNTATRQNHQLNNTHHQNQPNDPDSISTRRLREVTRENDDLHRQIEELKRAATAESKQSREKLDDIQEQLAAMERELNDVLVERDQLKMTMGSRSSRRRSYSGGHNLTSTRSSSQATPISSDTGLGADLLPSGFHDLSNSSEKVLRKLARRCSLFQKERDHYKKIIASYELDNSLEMDTTQQDRIQELEEALEDYRRLFAEEDLHRSTQIAEDEKCQDLKDVGIGVPPPPAQDEHLHISTERVIHLRSNPVDDRMAARVMELDRLRNDNQRLAARLELMERGQEADITRQLDEGLKSAQEVAAMRKELRQAKGQIEHMMSAFRRTTQEFREVVFLLTGYKIDVQKGSRYRLRSVYATNLANDWLLFEICPTKSSDNGRGGQDGDQSQSNSAAVTNQVQLLGSEYSESADIQDLIDRYLVLCDSFPAFLAALTLQLFQNQTVCELNY